jgi:hypothetical protein
MRGPLTMPPVQDSEAMAAAIQEEIEKQASRHRHSGSQDLRYYNASTLTALLASGTATVSAANYWLMSAAICSAIATFLIAVEQTMNFNSRWRWHLQRQHAYRSLGYRLNAVALKQQSKRERAYAVILSELQRQGALDAVVPGSGELPDLKNENQDPEADEVSCRCGNPSMPSSSQTGPPTSSS